MLCRIEPSEWDRPPSLAAVKGRNQRRFEVRGSNPSDLSKACSWSQPTFKYRFHDARGSGKLVFEGGQTPLRCRLPKRGFKNPFGLTFSGIFFVVLKEIWGSLLWYYFFGWLLRKWRNVKEMWSFGFFVGCVWWFVYVL